MATTTTTEGSKIIDLVGQLKLATVIVGVVDLGLTASSYLLSIGSEQYFLAIIIIALLLSVLFGITTFAGLIPATDLWRKIDMIYHGSMALLLILGAIAMQFSLVCHWAGWGLAPGTKATRIFALLFGIINSGIYGYISFMIFKTPVVLTPSTPRL